MTEVGSFWGASGAGGGLQPVSTPGTSTTRLVAAIQHSKMPDAFRPRFSPEGWQTLGSYLIPTAFERGSELINQGERDRSVYFIESGAFHVHLLDASNTAPGMALLRAGAIVGESALFDETPRRAQVVAISPGVVWALSRPRMDEMRASWPELAFEVLRASGVVMAYRMRAAIAHGAPLP